MQRDIGQTAHAAKWETTVGDKTDGKKGLLYATHEGSVAAAGSQRIDVIEGIWPECRSRLWKPLV